MKLLYLMFLAPATLWFLFNYLPIYGVIIAFKEFRIADGIWGSPFNGFNHFRTFFGSPFSARLIRNTVILSALRLIFGFPAPIVLALLLNEVRNFWFKRTVQSISYLPHFMSWVVLGGMVTEVLSPQRGVVALVAAVFRTEAPMLLTSLRWFRTVLVVSGIWQSVGWGTIVYLAAISSINPELYESADMDGANRFQKMLHVTLPSIVQVVAILFILSLGSILNAGFDQVFNLYNPLVYEVADIIDTYVYRVGLLERQYDFSAAIGLFKNVIGVALLALANSAIRRVSEYGIW